MTASRPLRTTVRSAGVDLAVWDTAGSGPPLLLVHGFPDTHAVWDPVVARLAGRLRCITYDVRGAGASGAPASRDGYRLPHLVTDLVAVLDAVSPDSPVHLVGHDWGSVQAWEAVLRESSDRRLTGRIASFTTISGPCLAHVAAFYRAAWRGGWDRRREAAGQLLRSWYVYAFQVPYLPEQALSHYYRRALARQSAGRGPLADTVASDAVHGLELYRANVGRVARSSAALRTDLPVQVLTPLRDAFVTAALSRDLHTSHPT